MLSDEPIEFLTVPEAAKILRVSKSTLYGYILRKRIDYYRLSPGKIYFKRTDLEKLIERSHVPAASR